MTQNWINSIGLLLDMVGAVMILIYSPGLPLEVPNADGKIIKVPLGNPQKIDLNRSIYRGGILLLFFGFLVQLISNWIPVN